MYTVKLSAQQKVLKKELIPVEKKKRKLKKKEIFELGKDVKKTKRKKKKVNKQFHTMPDGSRMEGASHATRPNKKKKKAKKKLKKVY